MRFGLRLPSFALGSKTASLPEMGAYLRPALPVPQGGSARPVS
jgi:hypothetical protein